MKVAYFHGAGHTELGGLHLLLLKIRADVTWERCFPAGRKPGGKYRRPEPAPSDQGATGADLVLRAQARLRDHAERGESFDAYVIVDDWDCRSGGDDATEPLADAMVAWEQRLTRALAAVADRPTTALFASPEIEAWFLVSVALRRRWLGDAEHAVRVAIDCPFDQVEHFGGRGVRGACEHKLSSRVAEALQLAGRRYSKAIDGADLVGDLDPDELAARLPATVGRAVRQIRGA